MAASTVTTDIAAELNITARRNDSFKFELAVTDPNNAGTDGNLSLVMVGGITGATDSNIYQGKMSIVDASSGDVKLNIYSARWTGDDTEVDSDPASSAGTPTTEGNYYGTSVETTDNGGTPDVGGGIDFRQMVNDTASNRIVISAPYTYMNFDPGVYNYDLQIRKRTSTTVTTEYTTWLYGTFTLKADITQL